MDQRNRLNPSVLESSDMSSLDTAEGGGGGGGGEARRERGGSGDRNREREHELLYLDEDEEAQLQEAIRLSMSEYERSREKHLVPSSSSYREEYLSSSSSPAPAHFPYSSSSMGEGQQQQEGSWRSIECDCRQEERRRSGGRGGGETSLSFLTSEEDALQQAIQASLQDIRGDVGAFSSHVGPNERDFSSSFSSRGKAEEREREDPVGGRRDLQGPRSSSIHPLPQSRKTEETFSYLERSPSFSFSNKSASSSACLFPQLFPSRTSASDDVSHLLLPASSSSLSFSSERHHHRQHSHSRSSSSSLLQGKSENDLCCAPLSWGEEEEEDIQIQLQWYYLTAYFSNRSSRSSSSSFLRSVKEGISRSEDSISSPSEETRECCLSCLVCRNFSFFEISLSRDSRGKPKEGDRTASITTTTTTTTSTDSSSSSSASSLTVPSSVGKRYEGQGGGGGEEKGLKKSEEAGEKRSSLPPLDFLYICDRCSYQHRGGGVHTLETSGSLEGHSTTFMPRDFLPLDLLRSSSSRSSSVGTREKYREKLLEILRPLEKDVLTSLLETVFGSRQTRAISTEGIKRWFDHPFLFGGDSVCNLVSSSSASLSFSGESKKREEEEQISSHEEGRREKERRERCLSSLHPFFACPWGLVQIHGGPCGVLASVESFLLSFLFFSPSRSRRSQVFLQDIYTFLHMTDEREKERYLLSKIGGGAAESSSSSVRVPLFSHIVSSLQKEEAGVRQAEEKKKEEEKESRDPSRCDVSSVHSREGKKRRGGEREVSSLAGEHSSEGDRKNSEEEEREEEEEKKKRRNPFVVNPEFLTLRGFTSLVRRHALIEALSSILFQCTYTSHYIVAYAELHTSHRKKHTSPSFSSSPSKITSLLPKTISGDSHLKEDEERRGRDSEHDEEEEDAESVLRECIQVYVQQFDNIQKVMQFYWEYYDLLVESPSSVVSLLFSVVLTRGIQRVCDDMDTRDHPLLGVYGHCSQELVNLLLLGMSTSNVFDGTKNLGKILPPPQGEEEEESALSTASREGGDGVHTVLRGIPKRPLVGFLTEMEALRYCEVGSGYKNPFLPVWVLGSGNHYTTLFSRDLLVSYLSPPRLAEMEAQAAFRVVDEENNMYIRSQQLPSLLALLGIEEREQEARRAIGAVDGVILWSEFLSWYTSFLLSHLQSQRSPSDETSMLQSPRTFTVYFYDGQTPPGPSLRRFLIRLHEDVDLRYSHHPGSYELSRILWTRWNSAEISQLSLLSPLLDLSSLGQDLHAASSSS